RAAQTLEPRPDVLLAWLADALQVRDRRLAYTLVTGVPGVPAGQVRLNDWSANELAARPGDPLTLTWHGVDRAAVTTPARFTVDGVVPLAALDPAMTPELPGLTDAPTCRDWDTGLPVDFAKIRPRDEAYWRDHRGTPKALLAIADAQRLSGS